MTDVKMTSSMTMSLATGIVKRDMRILREGSITISELYVCMATQGRGMGAKKRVKLFESLLENFKGFWYRETYDGKVRRFRYILWELTDRDELDRIDIHLRDNTLKIEPSAFGLSFHALVRCVYRLSLSSLHEAQCECSGRVVSQRLVVTQVAGGGGERNFRTKHGFLIVKMFDDGCIRGVTWVSDWQAKGDQLEKNSDIYSSFEGVAEVAGMSLTEHIADAISRDKDAYSQFRPSYVRNGGDLTDIPTMAIYYASGRYR